LTSEAQVIDVPGLPSFAIEPHNCFACGTLNATGLGLVLHVERGRSWVELALEPRFQGWDGIAHGGIICAILDEVMAWALVGEDNWGLTARLSVDFKRPIQVGQAIRATGWITRSRRRVVDTAAEIRDAGTGSILATATGIYVAADEGRKAEMRKRYGWVPLSAATGSTSSNGSSDPTGSSGARASSDAVVPSDVPGAVDRQV
jgi:acyl-coenzyme A thioesterase PaaI-like protein